MTNPNGGLIHPSLSRSFHPPPPFSLSIWLHGRIHGDSSSFVTRRTTSASTVSILLSRFTAIRRRNRLQLFDALAFRVQHPPTTLLQTRVAASTPSFARYPPDSYAPVPVIIPTTIWHRCFLFPSPRSSFFFFHLTVPRVLFGLGIFFSFFFGRKVSERKRERAPNFVNCFLFFVSSLLRRRLFFSVFLLLCLVA